jgi:hypothetical protein
VTELLNSIKLKADEPLHDRADELLHSERDTKADEPLQGEHVCVQFVIANVCDLVNACVCALRMHTCVCDCRMVLCIGNMYVCVLRMHVLIAWSCVVSPTSDHKRHPVSLLGLASARALVAGALALVAGAFALVARALVAGLALALVARA